MAKAKKQIEEESVELEALELFADAQSIVAEVFGDVKAKDEAYVFSVYDYLENFDDVDAMRATFVEDLKKVVEIAKTMFEVTEPSAEQVFGLFDRLFGGDDD